MQKPPILLLHGALGSTQQLNPLLQLLTQKFEVHSFDFYGHGKNNKENEFSIQAFAKQLHDYIVTHQLQNCTIFGYSMGGYVALYYFATYEKFGHKLITLGTKFDWSRETALKETAMLNSEKIAAKVPKYAAKLEEIHTGIGWKNVLHGTKALMLSLGNSPALHANNLQKISNEVTLCIGALDEMVSIEETEQVQRHLSSANLKVIKDTPHPIQKVSLPVLQKIVLDSI